MCKLNLAAAEEKKRLRLNLHDCYTLRRQQHSLAAEFVVHLRLQGEALRRNIEADLGVSIILPGNDTRTTRITLYGQPDAVIDNCAPLLGC